MHFTLFFIFVSLSQAYRVVQEFVNEINGQGGTIALMLGDVPFLH
jgi:hypothetical protein